MNDPVIPFWYTQLGEEESDAVARTIAANRLSQGAVTEEFETALATFLNARHVVATINGSMALFLAATASGIGEGDEVIVPDRTFIATANAMLMTGASVKLVDVMPDKPLIDPARVAAAITEKTKAIVAVHLNGNAANTRAIGEIAAARNLLVLEDTAQAFASRSETGFLGTESHAGCFSLGVTKLITTGQGGFVATNDDGLAERMRKFRTHGVESTFSATYDRFGFNLKFTDMQAAIGLVQLTKITQKILAHKAVYAFYERALAGLDFVRVCPADARDGCVPLWTEALVRDRESVVARLNELGIQVRPYLPSLHASAYLGPNDPADFANSRAFAEHGIFLPSGPDMPTAWLERVCTAFWEMAPLMSPLSPSLVAG